MEREALKIKYAVSRIRAGRLGLSLLLLCCLAGRPAAAETAVVLGTELPAAGEKVVLEISDDRTDRFSYVLMHGGRTVGSADDVGETRIAFVPQEAGDYLLRVLPAGYEEDACYFSFTVREAETGDGGFVLYGQKDGRWTTVPYGNSTLEVSGCAIFALSHALQRLGYQGEEIEPAVLAGRYKSYLGTGGTRNGALISRAARDFGFTTRATLYTTQAAIRKKLLEGCVFTFGIVDHHIALIDGLSGDGTMVHVVDSAPSSTMRHITGASPYVQDPGTGAFRPAERLTEIPGVCYCLETHDYDGAEYWLPLSYAAKRGLRLIQPGKGK